MNYWRILRGFGTQEEYMVLLENLRWGDKKTCPYCGSTAVWKQKKSTEKNRQARWGCSNCYHRYSVTAATVFHNSQLKLKSWFEILYYTYGIERLGSREIARRTGIPRGTVWKIQNRTALVLWKDGPEADLLNMILRLSE